MSDNATPQRPQWKYRQTCAPTPDATDIPLREKRQTSSLSVNITGIQARLAFGMGLCATELLGTTA